MAGHAGIIAPAPVASPRMTSVGRLVAVLLGLVAAAGPSAALASARAAGTGLRPGHRPVPDGWVVSGSNVLARLDEHLQTVRRVDAAIPADWAARGFDHIGDVDVAGTRSTSRSSSRTTPGAARRWPATTPGPSSSVTRQTVAPARELVRRGRRRDRHRVSDGSLRRRRAAALRHPRRMAAARAAPPRPDARTGPGGAVARGAVWLATDDDRQRVYRVDIGSGAVTDGLGTTRWRRGRGHRRGRGRRPATCTRPCHGRRPRRGDARPLPHQRGCRRRAQRVDERPRPAGPRRSSTSRSPGDRRPRRGRHRLLAGPPHRRAPASD